MECTSRPECDELYRTREVLEPLLLMNSVPTLPPPTIEEMQSLQEQMQIGAAEIEESLNLDRQFHTLNCSSARLPYIRATVEQLLNGTEHYRQAHAALVRENTFRLQQLHSYQHAILLATARHDADEARQLMRLHTRRARLDLSNHPGHRHRRRTLLRNESGTAAHRLRARLLAARMPHNQQFLVHRPRHQRGSAPEFFGRVSGAPSAHSWI